MEGFFRSPRVIERANSPMKGGTASGFDSPAALLTAFLSILKLV